MTIRLGDFHLDREEKSVWTFLEQPNEYAKATQALYEWSRNCNREGNPFTMFLDLVGWTAENYGEQQRLAPVLSSYGYVELEYLSDALSEFVNTPYRVIEWIDELMTKEGA